MPSGKRSRQRRTAAAPSGPRARRASPRVLAVAGAVAAAVAVGVVLAVVFTRGSSKSVATATVGSLANAVAGAADVHAMLKGIPQNGTTLGSPSAPVTMVEYVDLQCPYCRIAETEVLPDVIGKYVRAGKLKVVLQPWAFIGPDSKRGQAAVLAAARQRHAFDFHALLFDHQGAENSGWLSDGLVADVAASIPGLQVQRLLEDRNSAAVKAAAAAVDRTARASGITSTPTFVVGKSGTAGSKVEMSGPDDEQSLVSAIQQALAG